MIDWLAPHHSHQAGEINRITTRCDGRLQLMFTLLTRSPARLFGLKLHGGVARRSTIGARIDLLPLILNLSTNGLIHKSSVEGGTHSDCAAPAARSTTG